MKNLSDCIWETRKSRIYSEKRLTQYSLITEVLIIWYSLLLVVFSIISLTNNSFNLSLYGVVGSIFTLVASVYLLSQRFAERASAMRGHYISLDILEKKVLEAENNKETKNLLQYRELYGKELNSIENHSDNDYLRLRWTRRNDKRTSLPEWTKKDFLSIIWVFIRGFLIIVLLISAPIIIWKLSPFLLRIIGESNVSFQ